MEYESRRFCFNAASKYRISKQAFSSSRSIRRLATTCASSRNCLWNVEILLFVNFRIESIKESGINKLKDSIGSATERAAFLGPGLLCKMFLFGGLPELRWLFSRTVSHSTWKLFEEFEYENLEHSWTGRGRSYPSSKLSQGQKISACMLE